jgi:hypothetical protein
MFTDHIRFAVTALVFPFLLTLASGVASDEAVPVRFNEGLVHGFLKLSSADGTRLADGDLFQTASGGRVTSRLTFHFKDGSLQDETTVFTQQKTFRLVTYHLVQKGPAFPRSLEMSIDARRQATVQYTSERGEHKTETEQLPADVNPANGMILSMLKNVRPHQPPASLALVVATPKPQVVTLLMSSTGDESFSAGDRVLKAAHYIAKVKVGGVRGVVAKVAGKLPPDSHVWVLHGDAPAFVKSEQPFFAEGPLWRIELTSPVWKK